jgi:UDPglucose--hexose-1-phosphate uridylyltransferase
VSELRWHPLLEQWVVIAAHRQDRPQMPADWCPFCPGSVSGKLHDPYDVALYPNDFPAFSPGDPASPGACDVVLYSSEHTHLPSSLPVSQWEKIVALWTSRSRELRADPRVKHVMIFENAGEAVGVTMPHPHGQIYAFPFIPPRVERELASVSAFEKKTGQCLYCSVLADEQRDARRIIFENDHFVAFAPHFARFPYETLIYPRRHATSLQELSPREARDLAAILSLMRRKYDALFGFPMPLMMVVHQFAHFYVEFLPLQRSPSKLKYLAAVESAAWSFLSDVAPERAAEALRQAQPVS